MFYRMLHFMSQKHFIFGLKGVIFMGTTQPIRNRQELQNFSSYYKQVKPHLRNYTLVVLGLNTALRISDLLNLRWRSVYDFKKNCFRDHLLVWEHKTGKRNYIAINQNAKNALYLYFMERIPIRRNMFSPNGQTLINRSAVHRLTALLKKMPHIQPVKRRSAVILSGKPLAIMHGRKESSQHF